MKKILLIMILSSCCRADYLIFVLRTSATASDKQAIRQLFKTKFNDASEVLIDALGKETKNGNEWWRLVVDEYQLQQHCAVDLSNVTKTKFDSWKDANLDNPAYFQVARATDWRSILDTNGFTEVSGAEMP